MAKKKVKTPARPAASSWLDETGEHPLIAEKARQLESFLAALADGRIEKQEIEDQEHRLVRLMKEVEPQLAPELHEKVTALLCELAAYDIMQMLYAFQETRPKSTFHG